MSAIILPPLRWSLKIIYAETSTLGVNIYYSYLNNYTVLPVIKQVVLM